MPSFLDTLLRRDNPEPDVPVCPLHFVEMRLRGIQGRPTRFSNQVEEEYTFIYFCEVEGCNETGSRVRTRSQIPVPGAPPTRPIYARDRTPNV